MAFLICIIDVVARAKWKAEYSGGSSVACAGIVVTVPKVMRLSLLSLISLLALVSCDEFSKSEPKPGEEELVTPEEKKALEEYTDGSFNKS